jgi:MOSC domain-containing protein YiiM
VTPLAALLAAPMRPGELRWIGLRPARRAPVLAAAEAVLEPERGLLGDHFAGRPGAPRQVTLVQAEHLAAIGAYLGGAAVDPALLRRNLVVAGMNLLALKKRRFRLGSALLEGTGECHPCSRMEEVFGPGGYNAVRGHGGITARVLAAGIARLGDAVRAE